MSWYVIYTFAPLKFEQEVKKAGLSAYMPMAVKRVRPRGHQRVKKVVKPAFGNYVFVEVKQDDPDWGIIRSRPEYVRTISDFVGPIDVAEEVIGSIMLAEAEGRLDLDRDDWTLIFDRGVEVVVTEGPWAGSRGIVETPPKHGEDRATVAIGNAKRRLRVDFISETKDIPNPEDRSGP